MKLAYICSPCRGDYEKNIIKAQEYCQEALRDGLLPIAPHVYFTQFVDDTNPEDRKLGLRCGLQLLRYCQLIRVYGCRVSSGMFGEIQLAGVLEIEIEVYGPPEFTEHVMAIYHGATIMQKKPVSKMAATTAAIEAGSPAAMPATPDLAAITELHIDISKTQATGLAESIEKSLRAGTSFLRGGADY